MQGCFRTLDASVQSCWENLSVLSFSPLSEIRRTLSRYELEASSKEGQRVAHHKETGAAFIVKTCSLVLATWWQHQSGGGDRLAVVSLTLL